jgi:Protein of unknown function (DUF1161)
MLKIAFATCFSLLACATSYADNCEDIRGQIEAKIKSAGVASYSVTVVDAAANAPGKVVGACAKGVKKIMYVQQVKPGAAVTTAPAATAIARPAATPAPAAPAASAAKPKPPAKPPSDGVLTECKDGSVSVGGDCKK